MKNGLMHVPSATVIAIALLIAAGPRDAPAAPSAYVFAPVAYLGDPTPAGGAFVNDFEPGGLNNHGDMAFGADVSTGGEGVFFRHNGQFTQLGRTNEPAPGGGTFEFGFLGPVDLNDQGDVAFNFLLKDFTPPLGVNAGTYRYSHATRSVTPVMMPFITPAPGGGTFQGTVFYPAINNRGDVVFPGIVETANGVHTVPPTGEAYIGLGVGIYRADTRDHIFSEVSPGDAAPGGGTFDYAVEPWINNGGDVSFIGHIAGEESCRCGLPAASRLHQRSGRLVRQEGRNGKNPHGRARGRRCAGWRPISAKCSTT